jgi:hypothetical protein
MNDSDWMKKWHRGNRDRKPGCVAIGLALGALLLLWT